MGAVDERVKIARAGPPVARSDAVNGAAEPVSFLASASTHGSMGATCSGPPTPKCAGWLMCQASPLPIIKSEGKRRV